MSSIKRKRAFQFKEWLIERFIFINGALSIVFIVLIFFFLLKDSQGAFTRKHTYGWQFDVTSAADDETNTSQHVAGSRKDALDGLDEYDKGQEENTGEEYNDEQPEFLRNMENTWNIETSEVLKMSFALVRDVNGIDGAVTADNDFTEPSKASKGNKHYFYLCASPEYSEPTIKLIWKPYKDFNPESSPYRFKLRLISAPPNIKTVNIDLDMSEGKLRPKEERKSRSLPSERIYEGNVELPSVTAEGAPNKDNAYLFELSVEPRSAMPSFLQNLFIILSGKQWNPNSDYPQYGMLPLILGTLLVVAGSLLLGLPLGWATAVYIGEIARPWLREILKPVVELLAAVPSIVVGFIGLVVVAPFIKNITPPFTNWLNSAFNAGIQVESGQTALTGAIMLAFMAIPTIVTVTEDAIRAVPKDFRLASLALGATKWETIWKAIIPSARSGFVAAAMLGVGRAIGETMAVLMVTGNSAVIPKGAFGIFEPVRTMTACIAQEFGEVEHGDTHYSMLFMIGFLLFVMTFIINYIAYLYSRRGFKAI